MEFRMKNFTKSKNQNQGLQHFYTHFKKLEEYAFAFFLVMIIFYQILIILVPKITENIHYCHFSIFSDFEIFFGKIIVVRLYFTK